MSARRIEAAHRRGSADTPQPALPPSSAVNLCGESVASLKSARSTVSALASAVRRLPRGKSLFDRLPPRVKIVCTNALCIFIFLAYAFFGGCVLLYLEAAPAERARHDALFDRFSCVADVLTESSAEFALVRVDSAKRNELAHDVAKRCLAQPEQVQQEWDLKSAFLFGFGLLTTLGYGRVAPHTTSSRMFAVAWGLLGVPFAVIVLSNVGLYLRSVERFIRKQIRKCSHHKGGGEPAGELAALAAKQSAASRVSVRSRRSDDGAVSAGGGGAAKSEWNVLPVSLALFVLLHLTLGAIFLPLLNTSKFDFINGFYYCYICFTGMEYGALVNRENSYFPIVLVYNCVGLAMSTIVLNVSSTYAKKLYYCSRRVGDFAQAKIWIGSKHLRVKELLSALSQTIGVDPDAFQQLDLDQMIEDAIMVKEGRLACVPQAYTFLEGIWPPELVPLFLRDGSLPDYVDADAASSSKAAGGVRRDVSQLSAGEANALRAAIALSTFANGCLHRTLCPTAPAPAFQTADEYLSPSVARKPVAGGPPRNVAGGKKRRVSRSVARV